MLLREAGDRVAIDGGVSAGGVTIEVVKVGDRKVRLAIDAAPGRVVHRGEVQDRINAERFDNRTQEEDAT